MTFSTTDMGLTAFLVVKGFEITEIKNHSSRKTFVFEDSADLKKMVEFFNLGKKDIPETMVDSRELLRVFRELKIKIHNLN